MSEDKKNAGRPRDETAGPALMATALKLVQEKGYGAVSISEIIKQAGVSRQSLYRRWPTKADLVLDALYAAAPPDISDPEARGWDQPVQALLTQFLKDIIAHLNRDGEILRFLTAAAQEDPQFRKGFIDRFVQPREEIVTRLFKLAKARGELSAHSDPEVLTALFHGSFWYRLLNDKPLDDQFAEQVVAQIFSGKPEA